MKVVEQMESLKLMLASEQKRSKKAVDDAIRALAGAEEELARAQERAEKAEAELGRLRSNADKVTKHDWPNCREVQCEQAHSVFRCVFDLLNVDCPDNIYVVGKAVRVMEAIESIKAELERVKKQAAAMREALYAARQVIDTYEPAPMANVEARWKIDLAISYAVGQDYVHKEELAQAQAQAEALADKLQSQYAHESDGTSAVRSAVGDAGHNYVPKESARRLVEALIGQYRVCEVHHGEPSCYCSCAQCHMAAIRDEALSLARSLGLLETKCVRCGKETSMPFHTCATGSS